VSFFIFSRNEVAPVVYDYAVRGAEGRTPGSMLETLQETFAKTVQEARATPPETVGPGYYALMRLDEFVPSRVVEAVVHGIDLTDPLGLPCQATPEAISATASILDELLAQADGRRPAPRPRRRRPGVDPCRVRPGAAPRPAAAPDRLMPRRRFTFRRGRVQD
jgi:hypothetical protein